MAAKDINEKIKELMRVKDISQREMAEAMDLSQPALYQRLNSDKTFPIDDLIKAAKFLQVHISDLVYEIREDPNIKLPAVNEIQLLEEIREAITSGQIDNEILADKLNDIQTRIATGFNPDGVLAEMADTLKKILAELKSK